jgi:hypothetical protein
MMATEEVRPVTRDQLVQRDAGQRSIGNDTLVRTMVNDLPALGVMIAVADTLSQLRQAPTAP